MPLGYVRSFGRLINTFRVEYNLSTIDTQNLYANNTNVTGLLGINGVSQNPANWGLPNLSFTNFGSLQDTLPGLRSQPDPLVHGSNGLHPQETHPALGRRFPATGNQYRTASNPRGSFVFTGLNTSEIVNGIPVAGTGFDFADFLLGLPQQTSVQYGNSP